MTTLFDPKLESLPEAQRDIWPQLAPARDLNFVLYGGTAVALYCGHRSSIDFDFFSSESLDKTQVSSSFAFMAEATTIQETNNTLVVVAHMATGPVKVSFFGGLGMGRLNVPMQTTDAVLLVASQEDLLATKLKATLDRAELKDYLDISALLSAGVSLERALGAFAVMYKKDPGLPLRALGYFKDGDLPSLPLADQNRLRAARDGVATVPKVTLTSGSLAE